jgi:hypothetical protein
MNPTRRASAVEAGGAFAPLAVSLPRIPPKLPAAISESSGGMPACEAVASAIFNSGRYRWLSALASDARLSAAALRVAIILFQRMNAAKGYAWPSNASLARDTNADRSTVIRATGQLERLGWIAKERSTGRGHANRYRLAFGDGGPLQRVASPHRKGGSGASKGSRG